MSRQVLQRRSGQGKSPSLARDLLMLGDIYLTLGWLAIQRWRHGPLWPWESQPQQQAPTVVTLLRPPEGEEAEGVGAAASRRG